MSHDPITRFRRFSRAVTTEVGALDHSFLGRGRPLGAARVLNAIGHGMHDVSDIRDYLGLDSGLMSRLLRSLEAEGHLTTQPHKDDARRRSASLTPTGQSEFDAYEALSNSRAQALLARHPKPQALLAAMDLVASAFGRDRIKVLEQDPRSEDARFCLGEYYAELARRFAQGFDVSLSRDPEAVAMIRPRGAFLVALSDGMPIGCVGLKGPGVAVRSATENASDAGIATARVPSQTPAQTPAPSVQDCIAATPRVAEVKRLWVSPAARGLGLARDLMIRIEESARALGYTQLRLDTNSALPEAVRLYRVTGWQEIARFNDDPYPDLFFEKTLSGQI